MVADNGRIVLDCQLPRNIKTEVGDPNGIPSEAPSSVGRAKAPSSPNRFLAITRYPPGSAPPPQINCPIQVQGRGRANHRDCRDANRTSTVLSSLASTPGATDTPRPATPSRPRRCCV